MKPKQTKQGEKGWAVKELGWDSPKYGWTKEKSVLDKVILQARQEGYREAVEEIDKIQDIADDIRGVCEGRLHPMIDDDNERLEMAVNYCDDLDKLLNQLKEINN